MLIGFLDYFVVCCTVVALVTLQSDDASPTYAPCLCGELWVTMLTVCAPHVLPRAQSATQLSLASSLHRSAALQAPILQISLKPATAYLPLAFCALHAVIMRLHRLESVRTMMGPGPQGEDPLDSEEQLQDQMDSLPYMCRLQYSRSADYLTQLADPCIQSLQERVQTGGCSPMLRYFFFAVISDGGGLLGE